MQHSGDIVRPVAAGYVSADSRGASTNPIPALRAPVARRLLQRVARFGVASQPGLVDPAKAVAAVQQMPQYFVNAWVDWALIGGVSIATFALLRAFYSPERTDSVYTLAASLAWVVNWPHFSATNYRLYHSRANIRQYPMTAVLVPGIVLAGVVASLGAPERIAPWFVKLFLIWSPYHFSGQTVGLTMIYARRAGFRVGAWERRALSAFVFGTFLIGSIGAEVGDTSTTYFGIRYTSLGLPYWMVTATMLATYTAAAAWFILYVRWSARARRLFSPIILLPAATQYVWFVSSANWESYREFVPLFHSLQYMLIAWSMQLREKVDCGGAVPSRRYVLWESGRWGGLNFVGGACLFYVLPRLAVLCGTPLAVALGVVHAAVQIHHFFVDGVIWKLRSPSVASPLMAHVGDLMSGPHAA